MAGLTAGSNRSPMTQSGHFSVFSRRTALRTERTYALIDLHWWSVGIAMFGLGCKSKIDVDGLSGFSFFLVIRSFDADLTSEMTGRQPWRPTNPQTQSL